MKLQTGLMSAAAIVLAASMTVAAAQGQSGSSTGSSGSGAMGQSSSSGGQSTYGSQSGSTGASSTSSGSGTGSSSMDSSRSGSSAAAGSSGASGSIASTDRKFIMEAASAGMLEVEAGRLASTRAQDPQLKSFAQRMVTEHTQNNQKLMSIAQARGVTPPNELDAKHKAMLDKLQRAQGAEFDQQFAQLMEKSHTQTVKDFEKARGQVQDPQLKSYIQATLPTLHEHHRMAQTLPGAKGSKQAMSDDDTGTGSARSRDRSSSGSDSYSGSGSSTSGSSTSGSSGSSRPGSASSGSSGDTSSSTSPNSTPSDTSSTTPPPDSPQ